MSKELLHRILNAVLWTAAFAILVTSVNWHMKLFKVVDQVEVCDD